MGPTSLAVYTAKKETPIDGGTRSLFQTIEIYLLFLMYVNFSSAKQKKSWTFYLIATIALWIVLDFLLASVSVGSARIYVTRTGLLVSLLLLLSGNTERFKLLWDQSGGSFNLAMFRIVFFGFFLLGFFTQGMDSLEKTVLSVIALPKEARVPLPLFGELLGWMPINEDLSRAGIYLFLTSCLCAFFGFKTRLMICVFTLSGLYIFGVPQLFGKINHNHHLVWFPAVLAFSGCGDSLSIDCLLKNKSWKACMQTQQSTHYGRALAGIWLLIGIIYFFPGFQKIWQSGLSWASPGNLIDLIRHKSLELPGWEPWLPLHRLPGAAGLLAVATLVFELGFVFAVPAPRLRIWAVATGLLFHLFTFLLLKIFFVVLVISYASFVNWEKWFHIKRTQSPVPVSSVKTLNGIVGFLLAGNIFCGCFNIHTWPFSCYPTFATMPGSKTQALELVELREDGLPQTLSRVDLQKSLPAERFRALELKAIQLCKDGKEKEARNLIAGLVQGVGAQRRINVYLVNISWGSGELTKQRDTLPLVVLDKD